MSYKSYGSICIKGAGPIIKRDIIDNIEPNMKSGKQSLILSPKYPDIWLPMP